MVLGVSRDYVGGNGGDADVGGVLVVRREVVVGGGDGVGGVGVGDGVILVVLLLVVTCPIGDMAFIAGHDRVARSKTTVVLWKPAPNALCMGVKPTPIVCNNEPHKCDRLTSAKSALGLLSGESCCELQLRRKASTLERALSD